jgi:hypothetical protein
LFCKGKNALHTCGEERGEIDRISDQLTIPCLQWLEHRDDDLGEFVFQLIVALASEPRFDRGPLVAGEELLEDKQIVNAWAQGIKPDLP